MNFKTVITAVSRLDVVIRKSLFELHSRFFTNLKLDSFLADLAEKQWVILSRNQDRIVAFSTLIIHEETLGGKPVDFMFTGDTIVDPEFWQDNILAPAIGRFIDHQLELKPNRPLYWFLICKGYRTYLTLPRFFKSFIPNPEAVTDPLLQELLDHICRLRYGDTYDPLRGILDFGNTKDFLAPELQEVPESRSSGKFIRYFLEKNPGWTRGDELVCLVDVSPGNQKPLFRRVADSLTGPVFE